MARTHTEPNCWLALLTVVLILVAVCGRTDSLESEDRNKKRDAQFAGETTWQLEKELGTKWQDIRVASFFNAPAYRVTPGDRRPTRDQDA